MLNVVLVIVFRALILAMTQQTMLPQYLSYETLGYAVAGRFVMDVVSLASLLVFAHP